jgi:hypothetical protein
VGIIKHKKVGGHSVPLLRGRSQFLRLARLLVVVLLLVMGNDLVDVGVVPGRDIEGRAVREDPVTWSASVACYTNQPLDGPVTYSGYDSSWCLLRSAP